MVWVSQELGNTQQGFISHIDYDKGEMRVGGSFTDANTGARVAINDPGQRNALFHLMGFSLNCYF